MIKTIFILLMTGVMAASAYAQNPENLRIQDATGTVLKVNVDAHILELKGMLGQMAFSVPKDAIITRQTLPVTFADMREGDSAFVQYYISSEAVYVVTSIVDSKTTVAP